MIKCVKEGLSVKAVNQRVKNMESRARKASPMLLVMLMALPPQTLVLAEQAGLYLATLPGPQHPTK